MDRLIITGVSPYAQQHFINEHGNNVWEGCGPVAALMLMSYYDKRFGYQKLFPKNDESQTGTPNDLIQTLRNKMHTLVVTDNQGLTDPTFFKSGLKSYVEDCGYTADMDSYGSSDIGVSMDDVFNKSVSLIQDHTVHVLLLDYDGDMGMFPSHYVVVVGYNKYKGKKLIVCNGFGGDFQAIDFDDDKIKPVRAIWMTLKGADGPSDGHDIGPAGSYIWTTVNGQQRLTPSVTEPPSKSGSTPWRAADSTSFIAGSTCSINTWDN
jgi:hypothetical protein